MPRHASHQPHPFYESWITEVQKPARYVGCEIGMVIKSKASVESRIALAFPDLYEIGMSHMGLRILYQVLNAAPDIACERVFAPWFDMEARLRGSGAPLVSLESATPLHEFDIVGFSLQFELNFTNMLSMLELGGIPLRAMDREENHPLVLGGGPVASHAECLSPFVDLFVLGEAEETLVEICRQDARLRKKGKTRSQRLSALDEMVWCYAPALHDASYDPGSRREVVHLPEGRPLARRAWVDDLFAWPDPSMGPIPATEAVFDRISIEVMRGCIQGCRFCQAGFLYRPVRSLSPTQAASILERDLRTTGWDEASLTALSPADHPEIQELLRVSASMMRAYRGSLSVSSLRAYDLPGALLDDLRTGRAGGLTFAPEAGTERLRTVINKNIDAEDLYRTLREVARRGFNRIKLYFMIGLPFETDEDVEAIADLGQKAYEVARSSAPSRPPVLTVSVSTFVPKPHTPFQWSAMIPMAEIRRRQSLLRKAAQSTKIRLKFHDPKGSILEGVISRADRRAAEAIEEAYRRGCRFDGWTDKLDFDAWAAAFAAKGLFMNDYLEELDVGGRLCWDHLDMGIDAAFLRREYQRAAEGEATPACGPRKGVDDKVSVACHGCGIECDLTAMREQALLIMEGASAGGSAVSAPKEPILELDPPAVFRLVFAKQGPATLWGHLDLVRHILRLLRRAEILPSYSQGFHPKPQITFGPPLPLGWAGLREIADVKIEAVPHSTPLEILTRLNESAPPGVKVLSFEPTDPSKPRLSRLVEGALYRIDLTLDENVTVTEIRRQVHRFQSSEKIEMTVRRKDKERRLDLKESVTSLDTNSRPDGTGMSVHAALKIPGAQPTELVAFLAGENAVFKVTRLGFWAQECSPSSLI